MLRIFLLSLFWAVCSTCLVRPWFWKGVIKKQLFNDYGARIGFSNKTWKGDIALTILGFAMVFVLSFLLYSIGNRQSLYGSFAPILVCLFWQSMWSYQGKIRNTIMLTLAAICAVLWIQDGIVGANIHVPIIKTVDSVQITTVDLEEDSEVKLFVSPSEIETLFRVNNAYGPTYNNGKYIYAVSGGENGTGIVIIDKDNHTKANFISCSYGLKLTDIRSEYPTEKLKELYITVSEDNVPYGLFAIAEKNWFFGSYDVTGYVMLNLITGETEQYTEEQLPAFVTNN